MANVEIQVNAKAIDQLAANIEKAKRQTLGRLAERGYQLLRQEVPVETGNLKQGVATPDVDYQKMEAVLTVSARSGESGPRPATVFDKHGKAKKQITLRPSPAFNYAEAVARGRAVISPVTAKALLVPVPSAPTNEGYVIAGGKIFVFRKRAAATPPNPFDERAADQLGKEAPKIGEAVLKKLI